MGASVLAPWGDHVDRLKAAGTLLGRIDGPQEDQVRADLQRQFAMNLAQGYFLYFQADPDYPEFLPFENSTFLAQPNPDGVYYYARVSGAGSYRIVGERGTSPVAGLAVGCDIIGMAEEPGKGFGNFDLDDLTLDGDGRFEVVFSAQRPDGYAGDWRPLHPQADFILLRQFSYAWGRETDVRIAIERLDAPPQLKPKMTAGETDQRLRELFGNYARRLSNICLNAVETARGRGLVNRMGLTTFKELGNGKDWPQAYFECVFELAEDEALVLETELPQTRPYWNVQVIDAIWNQVELVHRQTSLNGAQARIDPDGAFRAVLAHQDPGVANWLDTGGNQRGMLIGRWYRCSSQPTPTLCKVRFEDLGRVLPAGTPRVGPEERRALLRERRIGAQLRRKW